MMKGEIIKWKPEAMEACTLNKSGTVCSCWFSFVVFEAIHSSS